MKVLVDTSNIIFISYSVAKRKVREQLGKDVMEKEDMGFFYHLLLNKIIEYHKTYGEVIYCKEGKHSTAWRKKIYPLYKENRKYDDSFQLLFDEFDKIFELLGMFPSKEIEVENAEGDDVIYTLATHFADLGEDVLVISSDKDLIQLHNFNEKIEIFNPMKRCILEPIPDIIEFKAIVGDPSDNIKGIPRLGKKTFEKMMLDKDLFAKKLQGNEELFEDILKIVDLRKFPKEIGNKAIDCYNNQEWKKLDAQSIELFMIDNKLNQQLNYWYRNLNDILSVLDGPTVEESDSFLDDLIFKKELDDSSLIENLEDALASLQSMN